MKPYILIELDKLYKFRLTFAGIVEYEQLTGLKFAEFNFGSVKCLENLLFVLMRRENSDLTPKAAAKAIEKREKEAFQAVVQAIAESLSTGEKSETREAPEYADFSHQLALASAELGINPSEFWELTPSEFSLILKETAKVRRQEYNNRMVQAWHTGLFTRMGSGSRGRKMLPLKGYLIDEEIVPRRKQTTDEMMAMARMLNAAFGGKEIKT